MRARYLYVPIVLSLCLTTWARAQFKQDDDNGAQLGKTTTQRWRTGLLVKAEGGQCLDLVGTLPVPVDWPEQRVKVVKEDLSPLARIGYETLEGGVKQMVVRVPNLPPGQEVQAVVTLEITRSEQIPPDDTDRFLLPEKRKLDRSVRPYLAPSPLIESTSSKIKTAAKQIGADKKKAWEKVEAIYDWVREKVKYQEGPIKGALAALQDGTGDCEELTSLFIALCRANGIPARSVWVPGHCYPEFCLEAPDGQGRWFPCQAAGAEEFGSIHEARPILQKGDTFSVPGESAPKRYVAETFRAKNALGDPRVEFIRKPLTE